MLCPGEPAGGHPHGRGGPGGEHRRHPGRPRLAPHRTSHGHCPGNITVTRMTRSRYIYNVLCAVCVQCACERCFCVTCVCSSLAGLGPKIMLGSTHHTLPQRS